LCYCPRATTEASYDTLSMDRQRREREGHMEREIEKGRERDEKKRWAKGEKEGGREDESVKRAGKEVLREAFNMR